MVDGLVVSAQHRLLNCRPKLLGAYRVRLQDGRLLHVWALEETWQTLPVGDVGGGTKVPSRAWLQAAKLGQHCVKKCVFAPAHNRDKHVDMQRRAAGRRLL